MRIPSGYTSMQYNDNEYKLKKVLYGLKQSPQACFGKFSQAMKKSR